MLRDSRRSEIASQTFPRRGGRAAGIALVSVLISALWVRPPTTSEAGDATSLMPLTGSVVDEQGRPLKDAEVIFWTWQKNASLEAAAQTDAQGQFSLAAPKELNESKSWPVGWLWVYLPGRRLVRKQCVEARLDDIRLVLPPGVKTGVTVYDPGGKPLAGAKVAATQVLDQRAGSAVIPGTIVERISATSNERGVATLTAVVRDELSYIHVTTDEFGVQSRYLAPAQAGKQEEISVKLREAGRIEGRIVAPDPAAVAGVAVFVSSGPSEQQPSLDATAGEAQAVSDAEGRFEIPAIAEGTLRYITAANLIDRRFLAAPPENVVVPAGRTTKLEIPLRRAVQVRGVVREKHTGRPLAGVAIGLFLDQGRSASVAETGADGRFEFLHLPGQARMYLFFAQQFEHPSWFHQQILEVPAEKQELELPLFELGIARGRVVDGHGNPVAGAKIDKALYLGTSANGGRFEERVMWYSEPRELVTGADGRYHAWVDANGTYRAEVQLAGHVPQWTEWTDFSRMDRPEFPDVVFGGLQSVAGKVVDRKGRPLAGVTVFQSGDGPERTETVSDAEGRFRLNGYQAGPGFIFAEKDGFRFHGEPVVAGAADIELTLNRFDEPPARNLETLPPTLKREDELALIHRVSPPGQLPKGDEQVKTRWLAQVAVYDPAEALDGIERAGLKGMAADMVRLEVVKQWAADEPDEARAVIESMDDEYSRAYAYSEAARVLPAAAKGRKAEWLGEAQLHLKAATNEPVMRLALAAHIADLLFEAGATDDALRLVRGNLAAVKQLGEDEFAAYVRGVTAEALSRSDFKAALELIKGLKDDSEYDRHHGNIARRLGAENPAEAQRVLGMVRDQFQRDQHAVRVAYAMAPADLEQARQVAESIDDPTLRAYAYVLMIQAVAATDKTAAEKLLDATYDRLEKLAAADDVKQMWGFHPSPVLAALLLPSVESLAPQRLDEDFWRTLSLRPPLLKQGSRELNRIMSQAYQAMFLARYDRTTARSLFANLPARVDKDLQGYEVDNARRSLYAAAAAIDPGWGIELWEQLPGDAQDRARDSVIKVLGRQGEARWQAAQDLLRLWVPWEQFE